MKLCLFFTDEKFFTDALLRTRKMIWCIHNWQPNSATSVPAIFLACIRRCSAVHCDIKTSLYQLCFYWTWC